MLSYGLPQRAELRRRCERPSVDALISDRRADTIPSSCEMNEEATDGTQQAVAPASNPTAPYRWQSLLLLRYCKYLTSVGAIELRSVRGGQVPQPMPTRCGRIDRSMHAREPGHSAEAAEERWPKEPEDADRRLRKGICSMRGWWRAVILPFAVPPHVPPPVQQRRAISSDPDAA